MNHFETIDQYFNDNRTGEQQQEFEQLVLNNTEFADEVAFYIKSKEVLSEQYRQQKKSQFKHIYQTQKQLTEPATRPIIINRLAVAASVALIVTLVSFLWLHQKPTAASLADGYISQNWNVLSVQMSAEKDSIQKALQLYNSQQTTQAIDMLEQILQQNPSHTEALKYSGIAYLQTERYDEAIKRFAMLASDHNLRVNPGNFYQSIALIKRNAPGDIAQARTLLRIVISKHMEGEKEARIWLQQRY